MRISDGATLTLLFLLQCSVAQECDTDGVCDTHVRCQVWKDEGECLRNFDYMDEHCPVACRGVVRSSGGECRDLHEHCKDWASLGECENGEQWEMELYCAKSCNACMSETDIDVPSKDDVIRKTEEFGLRQKVEGSQHADILELIKASIAYMEDPTRLAQPSHVVENCKNRHELCSFWAVLGECEKNQGKNSS